VVPQRTGDGHGTTAEVVEEALALRVADHEIRERHAECVRHARERPDARHHEASFELRDVPAAEPRLFDECVEREGRLEPKVTDALPDARRQRIGTVSVS
jgi:hypothetical protein